MGIADLYPDKKKPIEELRRERFNKLKKGKTKEQIRKLEQELLKPKTLVEYKGNLPGKTAVEKRKLVVIFKAQDDFDFFRQYVKVNEYMGYNTRDMDMILEFFRCLENGSLCYNEDGKVEFVDDQGTHYPL